MYTDIAKLIYASAVVSCNAIQTVMLARKWLNTDVSWVDKYAVLLWNMSRCLSRFYTNTSWFTSGLNKQETL